MGAIFGLVIVAAGVVLFFAAFGPDHLFIPLSDKGYWTYGRPPLEKP